MQMPCQLSVWWSGSEAWIFRRLACCLALLAFSGCARPAGQLPGSDPSARVETPNSGATSELKLVGLDGHDLWPVADETTKAIALVFILPDCPICNAYMPELKRLNDEFAPQGIPLVLVHADTQVTVAEAENHKREYQISLPVALDSKRTWIQQAEATMAPEAAVFSPQGELLYRGRIDNQYAGLGQRRATVNSHDLRDACAAVLAGQPVKEPRTEAIGCFIPRD